MRRVAQQDPDFDRELRVLWEQARTELHARTGGVMNHVSGSVGGNIVQAGKIEGGITFGPTSS
ncbi:hypothetical protein GCM10012275_01710 [Longimycelium tulufanense]|uniref:Uncharacterized protein n=1 Tax=Longimycelium tulufanense TaxID=907463 RepID=A0A8J3C9H8_9PSEU|nr:hypothetical protein [Longimycelium tulufanense]GGM33964.1 hypothetical protein GCM10012275_01710 [Longimycelium tulufanense]